VGEKPSFALISDQTGKWEMAIFVNEKRANQFNGAVGYQPGRGSQKGYLIGHLYFSFMNIFGTARQFIINWEKRDRISQGFSLSYREPWIFQLPLSAAVSFYQNLQDTLYVQRGAGFQTEYSLFRYWSFSGEVNREEIIPTSSGRKIHGMDDHRIDKVTAGITFSTLDYPDNPTKGAQFVNKLSGERILQNNRSRWRRAVLTELQYIKQILPSHLVYVRMKFQEIADKERVPYSDRITLGGVNTLRGFKENQFRGIRVETGTLEYRLVTGLQSRVYIFADGALIHDVEGRQYFKWGYGAGALFNIPQGRLGVAIGIPEGSSIREANIHIKFVNIF
jgi:outer membrane protein insertion porin family